MAAEQDSATAPPPPLSPTPAERALGFKMLGMGWAAIAEQLGITVEAAEDLVREELGMPGAHDEDLLAELDRQRIEVLYARTQKKAATGDHGAIRTAAQLLAKRPRRPSKPTLDPLRSAVRRGIARGLEPKRILAEFSECQGRKLAEITRLVKEEQVEPASTTQAQRQRRVTELEAIKREAPDSKTVLSALRVLIKLDGSMDGPTPRIYDEVWALIGRLEDHQLPDRVVAPRPPSSAAERQLWRARLTRCRSLLMRAADDVAAFRRLGDPPVGVVIKGRGAAAEKVGRMSLINLYAQEHAATALHLAAMNPASTPAQRADAVARLVGTIAVNHQGAETSEWVKKTLEAMGDPSEDEGAEPAPTSAAGKPPAAEASG